MPKKASEGIALLSMYGDGDDEMEDLDDDDEQVIEEEEEHKLQHEPLIDAVADDFDGKGITPEERGTTPSNGTPLQPQSLFSPHLQQTLTVRKTTTRLTIVDYGHEEGAMSPEPEDGEIPDTGRGRVTYGDNMLQTPQGGESDDKKSPGVTRNLTPSTHATPQSLDPGDQSEPDAMNYTGNDLESAETEDDVMLSVDEQKDVDPLDRFLPPPPRAKCSEKLQEKIRKFLALKRDSGRSFNAEVRNRKEYRNPDFLLHAVTYQNIDQIGSCFSKDVFDPHGYDKSDFYDEIEADMRRELERRQHESKRSQKIDFAAGGLQPSPAMPTSKLVPNSGSSTIAAGISNMTSTTSDAITREGRLNKKSKWDKVDVDQRNLVVAGGQENLPVGGAHASILSAAKAGSGYSAFANQRRKEAEEKRSSDKKLDRRS